MQTRMAIRAIFMLTLVAPCAAHAGLLGTRDGEWNNTVTTTKTGTVEAMTKEEKANYTPQVLAYIKSQEGQPNTVEGKFCAGPTQPTPGLFLSMDCETKVIRRTATLMEIEQTCPARNGKSNNHVLVRALSPTHLVTTEDLTNPGGSKTHTVFDATWTNADCTQARY